MMRMSTASLSNPLSGRRTVSRRGPGRAVGRALHRAPAPPSLPTTHPGRYGVTFSIIDAAGARDRAARVHQLHLAEELASLGSRAADHDLGARPAPRRRWPSFTAFDSSTLTVPSDGREVHVAVVVRRWSRPGPSSRRPRSVYVPAAGSARLTASSGVAVRGLADLGRRPRRSTVRSRSAPVSETPPMATSSRSTPSPMVTVVVCVVARRRSTGVATLAEPSEPPLSLPSSRGEVVGDGPVRPAAGVPIFASGSVCTAGSKAAPSTATSSLYGLSSSGDVRRDSTSISQTPGLRVGVRTHVGAAGVGRVVVVRVAERRRAVVDRNAVRVDGDEAGLAARASARPSRPRGSWRPPGRSRSTTWCCCAAPSRTPRTCRRASPASLATTTVARICLSTPSVFGSSTCRIALCTPALPGFAWTLTVTGLFSGSETVLAAGQREGAVVVLPGQLVRDGACPGPWCG